MTNPSKEQVYSIQYIHFKEQVSIPVHGVVRGIKGSSLKVLELRNDFVYMLDTKDNAVIVPLSNVSHMNLVSGE